MTRPAHDLLGARQKARSLERAAGVAHAGAGVPQGRSVSPYRGRARLRATAGAGDGMQRQVLMTWPWSPAHAEDIAADAGAAGEAFLAGTPLDGALQLHLTSKGAETEPSWADIPPAVEPNLFLWWLEESSRLHE